MELSNEELLNISGGKVNFGIFVGIGAFVTFLIGLVDGYLRPLKCNK